MKITESESLYNNLEKMSFDDLLTNINREDQDLFAFNSQKKYQEAKKNGRKCKLSQWIMVTLMFIWGRSIQSLHLSLMVMLQINAMLE